MFDATLDIDLRPGSNHPGDVPGANWRYTLPRLCLDSILCVGAPSERVLEGLAQTAQRVDIWGAENCEREALANFARQRKLANVAFVAAKGVETPPSEFELLFVVNGSCWRKFAGSRKFQEVVGPDKNSCLLYADQRVFRQICPKDLHRNDEMQTLWITPLQGEVETAALANDAATIRYFTKQRLTASSLTIDTLKQKLRRKKNRGHAGVQPARQTLGKQYPKFLRSAGHRILAVGQAAEAVVSRHRRFSRKGVLYGPDLTSPPEYLCQIAAECGVDLRGSRWGLVARNTFRSRKACFLLFDRHADQPRYFAKLPLDPHFSRRIDLERRALLELEARANRQLDFFPQVAFFGAHAGRSILGQTVVDGSEYASLQRDCYSPQLLERVVDTLINLGACTRTHVYDRAWFTGELDRLRDRFFSIYSLARPSRDFVEDQFNKLSAAAGACPLVFQHGDPHCTNVLASPAGNIGLIDWEAAQPAGMPLWDLLHFLRAHCMLVGQVRSVSDQLQLFESQVLRSTPTSHYWAATLERCATATHTPPELIRPLFFLCWVHRAVREAARLKPESLQAGCYVNLLQKCIEIDGVRRLSHLIPSSQPLALVHGPVV